MATDNLPLVVKRMYNSFRDWMLPDIQEMIGTTIVGGKVVGSKISGTIPTSSLPAHASTHKSGGSDTITPFGGEFSATDLVATGLTGATAAGRWVGNTTSGAPVTGTFLKGDWVTAQNGHVWICTTAGSPGTWVDAGAGSGMTNPMTTVDDIIVGGTSGTPTRKAKGGNNTVWGVDGSGTLGYKADPTGGSGNVITQDNIGSEPGSPSTGDLNLPPNGAIGEVWDGSKWAGEGPLYPLVRPPTVAGATWSWINQGSSTVADSAGGVYLYQPGHAGDSISSYVRSYPGTPFTLKALIRGQTSSDSDTESFGLIISDGTKLVFFAWEGLNRQLKVNYFTNSTTFSSTAWNGPRGQSAMPIWMAINDDGTNLKFQASVNGQDYITFTSLGRAAFLTPSKIGIGINAKVASADNALQLYSWTGA